MLVVGLGGLKCSGFASRPRPTRPLRRRPCVRARPVLVLDVMRPIRLRPSGQQTRPPSAAPSPPVGSVSTATRPAPAPPPRTTTSGPSSARPAGSVRRDAPPGGWAWIRGRGMVARLPSRPSLRMSIRRRSERSRGARSRVLLIAALALTYARPALADDDGLEPYRERFRLGMERCAAAGAMSEAVRVWGAISDEELAATAATASPSTSVAPTTPMEKLHARRREVRVVPRRGEQATRRRRGDTGAGGARRAAGQREDARAESEPRPYPGHAEKVATELAQVDDLDPRLGSFMAYVAPGRHVVSFGCRASGCREGGRDRRRR